MEYYKVLPMRYSQGFPILHKLTVNRDDKTGLHFSVGIHNQLSQLFYRIQYNVRRVFLDENLEVWLTSSVYIIYIPHVTVSIIGLTCI